MSSVFFVEGRHILRTIVSHGNFAWRLLLRVEPSSLTGVPSMAIMTSPSASPARAAGDPAMMAVVFGSVDAISYQVDEGAPAFERASGVSGT